MDFRVNLFINAVSMVLVVYVVILNTDLSSWVKVILKTRFVVLERKNNVVTMCS